jgi:hypothetical protein
MIAIGDRVVIELSGITQIAAIAATLMFSACRDVYEIRIIDANAGLDRGRSHYRLSATINRRDVDNILDSEIYAHLVVFDCENESRRYPAEPDINSVPLSNFSLARRQLSSDRALLVEISGDVPKEVWDRYSRVCLRMNGGSYLGRELASNVIPLRITVPVY